MQQETKLPSTRKINVVQRSKNSDSSLSLKTLLNPVIDPESEIQTEEKRTPFSQNELIDKWRKFAYSIKLQDLDLYSTLSSGEPTLKDDFKIEFTIHNTTQEADINNKKQELLTYLRKQFNNTVIDLTLLIDSSKEQVKAFTDKDKYKQLVEANPKVDDLRKRMGLHF